MASLLQYPVFLSPLVLSQYLKWQKLCNFIYVECNSNRINYNNAWGEITCPNLVFLGLIQYKQADTLGNIIIVSLSALN